MTDKRGAYSKETLLEAVRLVNEDGFSFGESELATGIPKSTIYKKAKASVATKQKLTKLTTGREEKQLTNEFRGDRR